jgi:Ca2+ transporting ATPase
MFDNPLFVSILFTTAALQVLIVEFGSIAFKVVDGGLDAKYWGVSLALGLGSLPVQQVINVLFRMGQEHNISRNRKRSAKLGHMTTKRTNGSGSRLPAHPHQE